MVGVQHTQRIHNEHGGGQEEGLWDGAGGMLEDEWVDRMGELKVGLKVDGGGGRVGGLGTVCVEMRKWHTSWFKGDEGWRDNTLS